MKTETIFKTILIVIVIALIIFLGFYLYKNSWAPGIRAIKELIRRRKS
ncbi:MAG: hypothetical protein ACI35W_01595 [Anaeroplasmataceae bacterium]